MDQLINKIINTKIKCYFLSPHLDDAAFSAGGLISLLSGKTDQTVINIFTSAHDQKLSLSAVKYLRQCKYSNATQLFDQRIIEDSNALKPLGVKIVNLGFIDALWRRHELHGIGKKAATIIPEVNYIYPSYRLHVTRGVISSLDKNMINEISSKINQIVSKDENCLIFAPFGIGNHVDHLIIRRIVETLWPNNHILWIDMPYALHSKKLSFKNISQINIDPTTKSHLVKKYITQFDPVLGDKDMNYSQEQFYIPDSIKI